MRYLSCFLLLLSVSASAQTIPLVNSGEVMKEASVLLDSGKHEEAIQLFLSVPQQDTNHVAILKELAIAYLNNDEYDKSIAACEEGLTSPSIYRAEFLRLRASATGWKGNTESALKLFEEAIREHPTNMDIRYSRAMLYYNKADYEKATHELFSILSINPYFRSCHLYLGLMAIRQGRKVHGLFAMGIYLALVPSDNNRLQLVNNFVDNNVTDEGKDAPIGPNASDKLDQIIRAKIAMEDGFQSAIPAKAPVIRQYELLFSQLSTIPDNADNPYVSYYLPVYKAFYASQAHETFIYHLLTSSPIEVAAKWRTKNKDKLEAFYGVANEQLKKKRERISHPDFAAPVQAWYYSNNVVEALGENVSEKQRTGKWLIYHDDGTLESVGEYNAAGLKKGIWKFYKNTGTVRSIENYDTGEVTVYHEDGSKAEHFFLKDDEIHGFVETYYSGGQVKEKLNFKNGKRDGKYESFYPDGTPWKAYAYADGKVDGEFRTYYANGVLAAREFYKDGQSNGPAASYYSNGKKESEGEYRNDNLFGPWKYYDANGRLSYAGKYSEKGMGMDEWVYYDNDGTVNERRRFDADGIRQGENQFFHDGKPYYTITYKKGIRIKVVSYRSDGSVLNSQGSNDGNFACTFYYPGGEPKSEGKFVKGQWDGHWKYYSRYGKLIGESDWKNDQRQGKSLNYHASGSIKDESNYSEGDLEGYYASYYENGKMEQQGWMSGGQRQQRWLTYTQEGTVQLDYYYLNGKLLGLCTDYAYDGKVAYTATYDLDGNIGNINVFDSSGKLTFQSRQEGWKTVFESKFTNQQVRDRYSLAGGNYYGEHYQGLPDGTPLTIRQLRNGNRESSYTHYYPNGQLNQKGDYSNGNPSGLWKTYYENGNLFSEGAYAQGNFDSLWIYRYANGIRSLEVTYRDNEKQGISRYYSPTGVPLLEKLFDEGDITHYRPVKADGSTGDWIPFKGNESISIAYPDGSPAWKENFKEGFRNGHHLVYYPGGQLYSDVAYELGDNEGPYVIYYPDGKIMEKGTYRNDEREGLTEAFRQDGTPFYRQNFRMGALYGTTTYYDEHGKVAKEYVFWNGLPQN